MILHICPSGIQHCSFWWQTKCDNISVQEAKLSNYQLMTHDVFAKDQEINGLW